LDVYSTGAEGDTMSAHKPYKGMAMEGFIARWYAKNTRTEMPGFRAYAETVAARLPAGARVLEVAPGPGYLAIEIARRGGFTVSGLDISATFVRIARDNAREAGLDIDFRRGNASAMPYADESFEGVVCRSAFKNFTDPLGALDEMHRVLAPGGRAWVHDLRKDASPGEIAAAVSAMNLSRFNAWLTNWIFRTTLLENARSREAVEDLVARSRFGRGELRRDGIGFELTLVKPPATRRDTLQPADPGRGLPAAAERERSRQ
jgi:ubiquinone/menaquinone biosynthesis C-methylase UbiE